MVSPLKLYYGQGGTKLEVHGKVIYREERSLGFRKCGLPANYAIRRGAIWLTEWVWFDHFITFVILANSVLLAIRDYDERLKGLEYESHWNETLDKIGLGMSIIFMAECAMKIISLGFVVHNQSYLRNGWNWLDFFVVIVSVLDFFPTNANYLKVFRMFRILRPLRSINTMPRMKSLISSLMRSMSGLCNVMAFLCFVLSIFAIFGVHQFKGSQYNACRATLEPILSPFQEETCINYDTWEKHPKIDKLCIADSDCEASLSKISDLADSDMVYKCGHPTDFNLTLKSENVGQNELIMYDIVGFEHFPKALLTVFIAVTLEGWSIMMYNYQDSNSFYITEFFFLILVIFGNFIAMNLLLAEIMNSITTLKEEARAKTVLDEKIKKKSILIIQFPNYSLVLTQVSAT